MNGFLNKRGKGMLIFGKDVKINSSYFANPVGLSSKCSFISLEKAVIEIGSNVGISNSLIYARKKIVIESDVLIGGGVQVLDNDFHSTSLDHRLLESDPDIRSEAIIIKRGAFIGANAIILKGVVIGEESVIAAGSIVSKSIPAFEIWGGNPARFIKKLDE